MSSKIATQTVFGFKTSVVDGVVYSSLFVGFKTDEEDHDDRMGGYQVVKMACEPEVCDALDPAGTYPMEVKMKVRQKLKAGVMVDRAVAVLVDGTVNKPVKETK